MIIRSYPYSDLLTMHLSLWFSHAKLISSNTAYYNSHYHRRIIFVRIYFYILTLFILCSVTQYNLQRPCICTNSYAIQKSIASTWVNLS
ncbi:hypothetical protein FKM82_010763 [Ascaphus truei]